MNPEDFVSVTIRVPKLSPAKRAWRARQRRTWLRYRWTITVHEDGFGLEHQRWAPGQKADALDVRFATRAEAEAFLQGMLDAAPGAVHILPGRIQAVAFDINLSAEDTGI